MKDGNGFSVSTVIRSLCARYCMTRRVAILKHVLVQVYPCSCLPCQGTHLKAKNVTEMLRK